MKISQTTIDDLMPELNHIIMMHNTGNPLFPLKQLPNQKGSIPLRDKNELETQFGITFDKKSFCDNISWNL